MALKVIFVDDDETSLFAWHKLIPWEECGCENATVFSSSADALSYIRNNPVDVVITDICMPQPSGLDIVDICSREQPNIKVILISAYRDFEYAQKALRYKNVVDYITKPLKYDTVVETLKGIAEDNADTGMEFSSPDDIYVRMQFFSDLLCGNVDDIGEVEHQFRSMGIDIPLERSMCTFVVFKIQDFPEFLTNTAKYNSMQVYNVISNLHPFSTEKGFFSLAVHSYTNVTWIVIHDVDVTADIINSFVGDIVKNFKTVLNVDVVEKSRRNYESVLELINILAVEEELKEEINEDISNDIIEKAIEYMKEHISENIFLNDVAQKVFMSPNYFSSYFKMKTGEKFIDALAALRMEAAAEILLNSDDVSVLDVCNMVGYSHLGYFYKKFKKHYGVTPMEYKERNQK